jgi:hypothetical protein
MGNTIQYVIKIGSKKKKEKWSMSEILHKTASKRLHLGMGFG